MKYPKSDCLFDEGAEVNVPCLGPWCVLASFRDLSYNVIELYKNMSVGG